MKKLLFTALAALALSCSSDDASSSEATEATTNNLLLKEIYQDGIMTHSYTYEDELIVTDAYYANGNLNTTSYYEYVSDSIINSVEYQNEVVALLKYYPNNNNQWIRDRYNNDFLASSRTYSFDASSCGYSEMMEYDANGDYYSHTLIDFTDENCSSSFEHYNSDNELYTTLERTRDAYHLYNKSTFPDFFIGENTGNITTYSTYDENNELIENLSYQATFEYNEDDYPTAEHRVYVDGTETDYTYTYY